MSKNSLTGRSTFSRIHSQGRSWSGGGARIRYIIEDVETRRFAVSIPKSVGNAVVRNRIRRRWREAIRLSNASMPYGLYHVMVREKSTAGSFSGALGILSDFQVHLSH